MKERLLTTLLQKQFQRRSSFYANDEPQLEVPEQVHTRLTYFGFWIGNSLRVRIERFQLERSPSHEGENFGERSSMVPTEHLMNTRRKAAKTSTAQT